MIWSPNVEDDGRSLIEVCVCVKKSCSEIGRWCNKVAFWLRVVIQNKFVFCFYDMRYYWIKHRFSTTTFHTLSVRLRFLTCNSVQEHRIMVGQVWSVTHWGGVCEVNRSILRMKTVREVKHAQATLWSMKFELKSSILTERHMKMSQP